MATKVKAKTAAPVRIRPAPPDSPTIVELAPRLRPPAVLYNHEVCAGDSGWAKGVRH